MDRLTAVPDRSGVARHQALDGLQLQVADEESAIDALLQLEGVQKVQRGSLEKMQGAGNTVPVDRSVFVVLPEERADLEQRVMIEGERRFSTKILPWHSLPGHHPSDDR